MLLNLCHLKKRWKRKTNTWIKDGLQRQLGNCISAFSYCIQPPELEIPQDSRPEMSYMRCPSVPALSPHLLPQVVLGKVFIRICSLLNLFLQDYEVPDISETSLQCWMWSPDLCPFSPLSTCALKCLPLTLKKQEIGFTSTSEAQSEDY